MNYAFYVGQRVRHTDGRVGEITYTMPGNGTIPWYFVQWDDGGEDRHTEGELRADWTPPGARPRASS